MKFNKSTTILLNVVLFLLVVLLVKSIITIPKSAYASPDLTYKVTDEKGETWATGQALLDRFARQGWRFHSCTGTIFYFER